MSVTFQVFEPYGRFWFPSIVKLIISEQIPGDRLSYFIVDAIVVMLSWSSTCIPEVNSFSDNVAVFVSSCYVVLQLLC